MRRLVIAAVALLLVVAALVVALRPGDGGGELDLVGSWFVRYRSDPVPYLDIAIEGATGAITSVKADLSGPDGLRTDIELDYVEAEDEWQKPQTGLPKPLPGGMWWVPRVRVDLADGGWVQWTAEGPDTRYTWTRDDGAAGPTSAFCGSFYMPPAQGQLYAIDTLPVREGVDVDTYLRVSTLDEPDTPIALNDDADLEEKWAGVALPLTPGTPYLVRVDGRDDNVGDYAIIFRRRDDPYPPSWLPGRPAGDPDPFETDDDPTVATTLRLGEHQVHSLSGVGGLLGDRDWFVVTVPQ